ncbi:MAG: hypothetical protein R8G33_09110 [Gammaproteobacteria bacterium]|nr:hypothetical protein [Gammaproteobacteria bacterium]
MDDIFSKWKVMWDAKEWGTQGFFFVSAVIALVIMSGPLRATNEGTATKKGLTFAIGLAYLILVIVGYFQLVPKISSY